MLEKKKTTHTARKNPHLFYFLLFRKTKCKMVQNQIGLNPKGNRKIDIQGEFRAIERTIHDGVVQGGLSIDFTR